jgi:hypothetical protein
MVPEGSVPGCLGRTSWRWVEDRYLHHGGHEAERAGGGGQGHDTPGDLLLPARSHLPKFPK